MAKGELSKEEVCLFTELLRAADEPNIDLFGRYGWALLAHESQRPPKGDWTTWLLIGGRGAGKTRAGAEWVRSIATGPDAVSPIALVGETVHEARAVMVEGVSGLLSIHLDHERPHFDVGRARLTWPNGVEALLLPGNDPERFRGPQFAAAWCDELAKWPNAEAAWDMLQFGLRLGERPRQLVTTTPRPIKLLKRLMAEPGTRTVRTSTRDNIQNLAPIFFAAIVAQYEQTVLGRQEIEGELIEDLPGALWTRADIETGRVDHAPEMDRIVVAIDPPVTGHAKSDACGIVVAGRSGEHAFVLADRTVQGLTPTGWARVAIKALQALVGVSRDGFVGPITLAAVSRRDPRAVINALCDQRLNFLERLATWTTFGRGWTARVRDVRQVALADAEVTKTFEQTKGIDEMTILDGYKTYAVGALMLVLGIALTMGLELPNFAEYSGPQLVMEALAVIFLRRGIKTEVSRG